jgi:Protein of unknown function (DUF2911)
MKKLSLLFVMLITFSFTSEAQKSPRVQADGEIFGAKVAIDYGAPSVRDRVVWGGLEDYGKVWRAGANENTTISFDKDVRINGKKVPAGKYGFFIIPNKDGDWVLILNKRNADWGAFKYNQKEDVLRVNVTPTFVDENQEVLQYKVAENTIIFSWEKARIVFPFSPM